MGGPRQSQVISMMPTEKQCVCSSAQLTVTALRRTLGLLLHP